MPPLKNARREKFAQELAKGKTATEAMADAGYEPDHRNTTRLTTNNDVQARLAELQERSAKRAGVTKDTLSDKLDQAFDLAKTEKQTSAMVAAVREQGILHGIRIERSEHGEPGEFEGMSLQELQDYVAQEAEAMGLKILQSTNGPKH